MSSQKDSGLDIDLGNACSKDAFSWAKKTFVNRQNKAGQTSLDVDGVFSNLLDFNGQRIGIASDGIGTKIELAERTQIYDSLGYDLVAMVADDLITAGFQPCTISNIIDVDKLERSIINDLMKGLHDACNVAGMSISGGEIAELGGRIAGYGDRMHFNWCSTAVGILPDELSSPIDGSTIQKGDTVLSVRSQGFRSNGFSLIRRILKEELGDKWHDDQYNESMTWGEVLLTPSLIYTPLINQLVAESLELKGVVHVTGGGVADNFSRVLKVNELGATLDHLHEPLPVMHRLIEMGQVRYEDAYLYWNMGNGLLIVCDPSEQDKIISHGLKSGYTIQKAGEVTTGRQISLQVGKTKTNITHNY